MTLVLVVLGGGLVKVYQLKCLSYTRCRFSHL